MAARATLRTPARIDLWSWANRRATLALSFAKNSTFSTPYAETSPMVALREYPIPRVQLDPAVFEVSEDDEYRSVFESFEPVPSPTAATSLYTNPRRLLTTTLLRLIRERRYIDANLLRQEMVRHGLPIAYRPKFIRAAERAAKSNADATAKMEEFCGWISLLPAAGEKNTEKNFGKMMDILCNDRHPDVQLIMAFVRVCVSKGYVVKVPDRMIPLVVRFAPPSVSFPFLEEISSSLVENFSLDRRSMRKIRFWCNTAMKEYLSMHRVEEAVKAFQMGLRHGPSLPLIPTLWLGAVVSRHPDDDRLPKELISALVRQRLSQKYPQELSHLELSTGPADPQALLSKVMENIASEKPPDPHDVARFLEAADHRLTTTSATYPLSGGETTRYRMQWLLGEMLYYAGRGEWRELIGTFDAYFFRVGVPASIDQYASRGRVTNPSVHERLFPSPYHTAMVWKAVVQILGWGPPVLTLFEELVEQAATSKTGSYPPVEQSPTLKMFNAAHFNPFMVTAYRGRKYQALLTIFDEMSRLGIELRVQDLSLLAGAHAGNAQGYEAIHILDRMETLLREEGTSSPRRSLHGGSRDAYLYIPALRGFVTKKNIAGASLVRRRILECGYSKGANAAIDYLLAKLRTPSGPASDHPCELKKT